MEKRQEDILRGVKALITDKLADVEKEERAEFFNDLSEWSYEQYDRSVMEDECEMQNYEEDGE